MQRPLTTKQAANYLGLSKFTLEAWRSRGGGPRYIKFARAVRYRVEDLDEFLTESLKENTSQNGRCA